MVTEEKSTAACLNVLILSFVRYQNMESIVRGLIKQDPNTKIYISLDVLDTSDGRYKLNMKTLERAKFLKEIGLIIDYQVSDIPLGCYKGVVRGIDWFFDIVSTGLILEEDLLIHSELVQVGLQLRESFNRDANLGSISLFSPETSSYNAGIVKFYKSNFPSSWGWISTREKWKGFIHEIDYRYLLRFSKGGILGNRRWKEVLMRIEEGSLDTWAYRWLFTHWIKGWYTLVPFPGGFIQNMGFDELATHTKFSTSKIPIGKFAVKWDLENTRYSMGTVNKDLDKLILKDRFGIRGLVDSIQAKFQ